MFRYLHYVVHTCRRLDSLVVTFPNVATLTWNVTATLPKKVKTEVPSDLYEVIENARVKPSPFKVVSCDQSIVKLFFKLGYVLSRAKNSGRQCHFKIWLDCHKLKKNPYLIMRMSTKCQKKMRTK
jgi:hypothetical protein